MVSLKIDLNGRGKRYCSNPDQILADPAFFGLKDDDIAHIGQVSMKTVQRWRSEKRANLSDIIRLIDRMSSEYSRDLSKFSDLDLKLECERRGWDRIIRAA